MTMMHPHVHVEEKKDDYYDDDGITASTPTIKTFHDYAPPDDYDVTTTSKSSSSNQNYNKTRS
eukprot:CAMPEP_0201704682 /NCGR_PEP_ID=MMETSP0578-20130828/43585_1 /ASSEMBLY_ACC=CAM_ASM_000663 /TAXON_ID=267565 /ORGANISM="Skeletonema grethea, Strain CCMP 1804" /LENGTH=62 /DNA_ID=CAMNT_0048192763 /DNA_START=38 /DNA_END=223 /DNA_ORIENTATION=+